MQGFKSTFLIGPFSALAVDNDFPSIYDKDLLYNP